MLSELFYFGVACCAAVYLAAEQIRWRRWLREHAARMAEVIDGD